MANILACIELERGEATAASLALLNEARCIASCIGATLSAVVPCVSPPSYGNDDIIAILSRHGADKVILTTHPDLGQAQLHFTHSRALLAACDRIRPRLVLLPASPGGHDVAPRLAVQLRASYLANARLERTPEGASFACYGFGRSLRYSAPLQQSHRLTLVTLITEQPPQPAGDEEAEVMVVHVPSPEDNAAMEVLEERPLATPPDLVSARVVVYAGAELQDQAAFDRLQELASALHGAVGASPAVCSAQLAPHELQLGLGGRCTAAQLCIAVDEPGSPQALAGLAPETLLVAITPDAGAPILRQATLGILDEGEAAVPQWLALLTAPAAAEEDGTP